MCKHVHTVDIRIVNNINALKQLANRCNSAAQEGCKKGISAQCAIEYDAHRC